jgi:purine-nucleoside phosphorylase
MQRAIQLIHHRTALRPSVGVVLGSGLGAFAESLTNAVRIPYSDIPGLPESTAVGHKGELVIGTLGADSTPVAVMSGRFHLYEGYSAREVAAGIRLFLALGIQSVVLTNAAGGINPYYARGALVAISDHINLQGDNPLVGVNDNTLGPRFPDMTEAYSPRLRAIAHETAEELGIPLHEGVYAGVLGPSYETPAEIRFLKIVGADLVGMSTVAETIAANHMGMEVLGISCVTNAAAGLSGEKLNHEEVLEIGRRVSGTFLQLLSAILPQLD